MRAACRRSFSARHPSAPSRGEERSDREEKTRREHFGQPDQFDAYYDTIGDAPDLWHPQAHHFEDWQQLARLGLMSAGDWS